MANTTDAGFEPGSDDKSSPDASTVGGHFETGPATGRATGNTPPFGDPDQHLYGGNQVGSLALEPAIAPSGPGYQGRHRAAD
jgi:hypothetical protein